MNTSTYPVGSRIAIVLSDDVLAALGRTQADASHVVVGENDGYLVIKPVWDSITVRGRVFQARESLIHPDRVVLVD